MQQYIGRLCKGSDRIFVYHRGGGQYRVQYKSFTSYDGYGKSGRRYKPLRGVTRTTVSGVSDIISSRLERGWKWIGR